MKVLLVCLMLILGATQAKAYDCQTVRSYVSQYGAQAAIRWARSQGYSKIEIAMVRAACFKGNK